MGDSSRALQEFVSFLSSPDMYGSMSVASQMLKWAVHLVVTLLAVAGLIAVLLLVVNVAINIVYFSGLGPMLGMESGATGWRGKIGGVVSEHAKGGDAWVYIKKEGPKLVISLAFIGLLSSGMLLPVAGQVAGAIGTGVDKIIGLDPAGKLAEFDGDDFLESITMTRPQDLKNDYDRYVSEIESSKNYIYDLGSNRKGKDDVAVAKYMRLHTAAFFKADQISKQMIGGDKLASELKLPESYFKRHEKVCVGAFLDKNMGLTGVSSCTSDSGEKK